MNIKARQRKKQHGVENAKKERLVTSKSIVYIEAGYRIL